MFSHARYFFLVALAGWMNRQQTDLIEYLKEENRVLREQLGAKRIRLTDAQKRRLATAAIKVGKDLLSGIATLFAPETLLRWHRMLVARKYDGSGKRGPKARKANEVRGLVLRFKEENPDWGYGRIHGELKALGFKISWQTVRRIMREHGLLDDPGSPKKMSWLAFIKSHFQSVAACDFFTVEAWTPKGLTRYVVFFAIDIATRRAHIAGMAEAPTEEWVIQKARNMTDSDSGFLKGKRFLIHDRDPLFTPKFRSTLKGAKVRCLKMPKQSPNLNAYAERFVWSIKHECINKMVLFGEKHAKYVIDQYVEHYNQERPHQGLGNLRISDAGRAPKKEKGRVLCRQRIGGLLKSYYRRAA